MTTPDGLAAQHTLATAVARYDELRTRDLLAPGGDDASSDGAAGAAPSPSRRPWNCWRWER